MSFGDTDESGDGWAGPSLGDPEPAPDDTEYGPDRPPLGSPGNPLEISDPRALRALAHPARIAILQRLVLDGPATATQCAEFAGLSPSACSYHLRALARYGFVEEEPSEAVDGRHRPWRARMVAISFGRDPDRPASVRAAGRMLAESVQARFDELRADYLDHEAEFPQQWQSAAGANYDVLHVTAEELSEVRARIFEILDENRRLRPQDRPPDARPVGALVDFVPWFSPTH